MNDLSFKNILRMIVVIILCSNFVTSTPDITGWTIGDYAVPPIIFSDKPPYSIVKMLFLQTTGEG